MYNIAKTVLSWKELKTLVRTVITKKRHFHLIKRRTLAVQYNRFYFFGITYTKKVLIVNFFWITKK